MHLALAVLLAVAQTPPAAPAPPSGPAPQVKAPRPAAAPGFRPAPHLPHPPAIPALPERRRAGEWPERPSGKTVTLEKKTSIDGALERIAAAAGWNLVANTGRTGDRLLILTLREVPVEEAVDAVLEGTNLVATRRGNTVTVAPGAAPPPPEVPVLSGFDKPTGRKFSGDFQDEDVETALRKVAEAGGLSVVLPPGLRGTVNARFKDAPVEEVLKVLLLQAGLAAQREGSIVTVFRAGGSRIVIRGGKRRVVAPGEELEMPELPDIGPVVSEAMREAAEEMRRDRREGKRVSPDRRHGGQDKVHSGDLTIGPGERAKNVVVFRGTARLDPGAAAEQVTTIQGSVELREGASVERDVVAVLGDVHLASGSHVGGDAVAVGGQIVIDEGAEVEGQQTSIAVPGLSSFIGSLLPGSPRTDHHHWALTVGAALAEFAMFFALGLLFLLVVPKRVEAVAAALSTAPLKTLITGLLATAAMPVLTVLLVVTIIGIPLVAVQAVGVVAAGVLGFTALAMFLGRAAARNVERGGQVLRLALGCAVMVAVGVIPVIGLMAWMTAWLFVFGAIFRTRFGQTPPAAPLETTAVSGPPPAAPPAAPA